MKVCFVGFGSIAKRHIKNLYEICQEKNIKIRIDLLRREHLLSEINCINEVYTNISDMPKDYDIIFITNPTEYHAITFLQLYDHSKNFFIEKPICTIQTLNILDEITIDSDKICYVACPLRYNKVIQFLKENIIIDKVNSVRSISSSYLPEWRPNVDYRMTYSASRDLGGGVDIDLIHEWDYLTYLFGMPQCVKMFLGKVSNLEINSNDYAVYIAQYSNMICELHLDYFGRKNIRKIEIYTDDDTIIGDIMEGKVTYCKKELIIDLKEDRDEYQKKEILFFLELIGGKKTEYNDYRKATNTLKLTQGYVD